MKSVLTAMNKNEKVMLSSQKQQVITEDQIPEFIKIPVYYGFDEDEENGVKTICFDFECMLEEYEDEIAKLEEMATYDFEEEDDE